MQLTHKSCSASLSSSSRTMRRLAARPSAGSSGRSRARSVQVEAKGKSRFRQTVQPGMGSSYTQAQVPEIDPDNEEFAIFVRVTNPPPLVPKEWAGPITVVKGGQAANLLVKGMETAWGRALYSKTLIRNIAQAIYKDKELAIKAMRKSDVFKNVPSKDFVFGFKIRDKTDARAVLKTTGITQLPPEVELGDNALDAFRRFWSPDNLASIFTAPASPAPPSSLPKAE